MTEPQQSCPNCGSSVVAQSKFCPACGAAMQPEQPVPPVAPAPGGTPLARCEMIIGYLVPHRCENPALGRCGKCGRGFCEEHIEIQPEGMVCGACAQGLQQPVALPLTAQTYTPADIAVFDQVNNWDDDTDGDDMFADLS